MNHRILFTKMHGLGNDFVVIDNTKQQLKINSETAKMLCNRKTGIGGDQLLIISQHHLDNVYNYIIYNSDGSQSEHCGNGARCVVKYIYDHYYNSSCPDNSITLQTKNRTISGTMINETQVAVSMGIPHFNPNDLPFTQKFNENNVYQLKLHNSVVQFGIVSVGNPHVIIELPSQIELKDKKSLEKIATAIQQSDYFPNSVNVNFYVKLATDNIELLTYERGCGFTNACGSGACATVSYGILHNQLSSNVIVKMQSGGELNIKWDKENQIIMTGEAIEVFSGSFNP